MTKTVVVTRNLSDWTFHVERDFMNGHLPQFSIMCSTVEPREWAVSLASNKASEVMDGEEDF